MSKLFLLSSYDQYHSALHGTELNFGSTGEYSAVSVQICSSVLMLWIMYGGIHLTLLTPSSLDRHTEGFRKAPRKMDDGMRGRIFAKPKNTCPSDCDRRYKGLVCLVKEENTLC